MANTTEAIRLMRHAADLLEVQDPTANANRVAAITTSSREIQAALRNATAQSVANGVAITTLRMVAAALDDEPAEPPAPTP